MRIINSPRQSIFLTCSHDHHFRPYIFILIGLVGTSVSFVQGSENNEGFSVEKQHLREPRTLKVHVLKVDLSHQETEVAVAIAADPDGDGPAESALMNPVELAKQGRLLIALNANPWDMVPATPSGQNPNYNLGGHCDIVGLAVADEVQRSGPTPASWSLWQDQESRWHLDVFPADQSVKQAISGFAPLLKEGHIIAPASDILHPRTAVGIDENGQQLIFVVVDGRQAGVSEGMSEQELAVFMKSLGCWNALNLDGGGSSVLLMGTNPRILNSPSVGRSPRPVPVMIGVRAAKIPRESLPLPTDSNTP